MISKGETEWFAIYIPNARYQVQISICCQRNPETKLKTGKKKKAFLLSVKQYLNHIETYGLAKDSYLWGQHFRSSSDGLSIRSIKDIPWESFGRRGGGLSSIAQILFLANPCCSKDPPFPNFQSINTYKVYQYGMSKRDVIRCKENKQYQWETDGNPSSYRFWGLEDGLQVTKSQALKNHHPLVNKIRPDIIVSIFTLYQTNIYLMNQILHKYKALVHSTT